MRVVAADKLMLKDLGNGTYLITEEAIRNAPTFEAEPVEEHKGCNYCKDEDEMYETVCYIPHDNGGATDIPVNFCPNCGRKLDF
jgi:hypothetical protein